ncbi:hypothetical protein [Brachyspira pulli]|uniref:hypothetical protein n=1 Tax=Brachyspira pulli TaxID=310721 RepID=UPI0030053DB8
MKKLTIIFLSLFIVFSINLHSEDIGIEKFAKLFENKAYIGRPHDEYLIFERTGEVLFNKVFYQLDGVISDNEFYFYYLDENYNYEKESYEKITNYCVFLFTNNALMMTPYNLSVEPDYIPPVISKNHEEAYSNYIEYKDSMETLFTLVDRQYTQNIKKLYDIVGNIYGTFESLDKRFSITLSEPIRKNDDYNFASSVSELNNEINYHIMMEDDVEAKNREGGYSEYDNPEWGSPYVYCSNYDNERYSSFDRIIFCYGSGGTEYQLYINIIDENTLILLEAGSIHKGKYGLNGVFKRKNSY